MSTLLSACGRGSEAACEISRKLRVMYAASVLTFSDVDMKKHPNKMPFKGTLLLVDEPSQKAPHGSQGHRIFVSKKAAKDNLQGIIGMAVNYDRDTLGEHATRSKVGVVTKAWIEDNKVMVSGFIWYHDFPEAERALKGRSDLGMSMELADVYVDDENESIWNLTKFNFTGATILKKDAAAYSKTTLAAKAAATREGENNMKKVDKKGKSTAAADKDTGQERKRSNTALLASAIGGHVSTALNNTLGPIVSDLKASNTRLQENMDELGGRLRLLEVHASADEADDDEIVLNAGADDDASDEDGVDIQADATNEEPDDLDAAKDDSDDSDDSDDDASDVDAALEDMGKEAVDEEPGELNDDASNKGSKKTVTNPPKQGEKVKGNVAKGRLAASGDEKGRRGMSRTIDAAAIQIEKLMASNRKLSKALKVIQSSSDKKVKQLKTQVKSMHAQVERFSEQEARRSVMPVELTNLASKAGINLGEVRAAGQKLSTDAIDMMFSVAKSHGVNIEPKERMAMKMQLEEFGVADQGVVERNYSGR
jgi:hypothetical protein